MVVRGRERRIELRCLVEVRDRLGLAIGRGALLNPWIFRQLTLWEETGDPGSRASFEDHLDFMHRHYHLLVDQRGEHFASLTFRKVANWYCRVLRPGREVQQQLMQLERIVDFDEIVDRLRERGAPSQWHQHTGELSIAVPGGPIERW